MRKARIIWFILSIFLGFCIGLYGGWKLIPVPYQEVTPFSLRSDYKADYVLMVAEIYHFDGDLASAISHLEFLGEENSLAPVQQAVLSGRELNYSANDIELMVRLIEAIQAVPSITTPGGTQ